MRVTSLMTFSAVLLTSSLSFWGCGSADQGAGTDPNNPGNGESPGLRDDPGKTPTAETCAAEWRAYVSSKPAGLTLRYRHWNSGSMSQSQKIVSASSQDEVTTTTTTQNGSSYPETVTKQSFEDSCLKGTWESGGGLIEARRKESKTVTAGAFKTNYIRIRSSLNVGGASSANSVTSELWISDDLYKVVVFEKTVTSISGTNFEGTSELVELRRP